MKNMIFEFRCFFCKKLFNKLSKESKAEGKCKKCKKFSYFFDGKIYMNDVLKYFKGDD